MNATRIVLATSMLLLGMHIPACAEESPEQLKARLDAVRKQIDDLKKHEDALKKRVEDAERRAAEAKEHFAKAEIKGFLKKSTFTYQLGGGGQPKPVDTWTISARGVTLELDFGGKKELLELAAKNEGKTVTVSGMLRAGSVQPYGGFGQPMQIVVESLTVGGK